MTIDPKAPRALFILGKFHVVERGPGHFIVQLGGTTQMRVPCDMNLYDIRDGDLLTLYTEVLLKPRN